MPLSKPYPKMHRPNDYPVDTGANIGGVWQPSSAHGHPEQYFWDDRASPDGRDHLAAFDLLRRDLQRLFEFIEPAEAEGNKNAYSHRTFELLVRTCMEVESNCKLIAAKNGHDLKHEKRQNIGGYSDLEGPMRLSEYEVRVVAAGLASFRPFEAFTDPDREERSPPWYRAYNTVKHNRVDGFSEAKFIHVVHAMGGLFVLLRAQYGIAPGKMVEIDEADPYEFKQEVEDVFSCRAGPKWEVAERYNFNWKALKTQAQPTDQHPIPKRP